MSKVEAGEVNLPSDNRQVRTYQILAWIRADVTRTVNEEAQTRHLSASQGETQRPKKVQTILLQPSHGEDWRRRTLTAGRREKRRERTRADY